jgi:hypothetical protein
MNLRQKFLVLTAWCLMPLALSYGADPQSSHNFPFGITIDGINDTHIFRAIMGLYFALSAFWLLGAYRVKLRLPALYCLTVFMLGLAAGRVLSVVIYGNPHRLLFVYFVLEVLFGAVGLVMIFQENKQQSR